MFSFIKKFQAEYTRLYGFLTIVILLYVSKYFVGIYLFIIVLYKCVLAIVVLIFISTIFFFDFDSSIITASSRATLDHQAAWLKKNSNTKIAQELKLNINQKTERLRFNYFIFNNCTLRNLNGFFFRDNTHPPL